MTIFINKIGKVEDGEYGEQKPPDFDKGSELWYAEVETDGKKITMYFDVTADEIKEPDRITAWVLKQSPLDWRTQ